MGRQTEGGGSCRAPPPHVCANERTLVCSRAGDDRRRDGRAGNADRLVLRIAGVCGRMAVHDGRS
eukprot:1712556-Prymnesium_polylepis.1